MSKDLGWELIQMAQRIRCYIRIEPDDGTGWAVTVGKNFTGRDRDLTEALLKAWSAFANNEAQP